MTTPHPASDNPYPSIRVVETAAPAAPAAGDQRLFIDPADHHVKSIDASGVIVDLQSANTAMVPAETPNGVITTFTVSPYLAGTAVVAINGLVQREGTDWSEVSPSAGTIHFTSAPWTGAAITVFGMVTA